MHVRKFQSLATVHRDERDGVTFGFLLLLAFGIETDLFQEGLQTLEKWRGERASIQRGDEVLQVPNAVLPGFAVLLGTPQLIVIPEFTEKKFGPGLQRRTGVAPDSVACASGRVRDRRDAC